MPVVAYIALGSNLDNPEQQIISAVDDIASLDQVRVTCTSRLYRSSPVGPDGQPDYLNAVVEIRTALEPLALLDALQAIEHQHGRERIVHWGARTLDLDILLYGDAIIDSPRLIIPHKEMHWRNFVLQPLADIQPDLVLPTGQNLQKLLQKSGVEGLSAIGEIRIPEPA